MNTEGKRLQKELAGYLREKDRAALSLLRAKIKVAKVERGHMLRAARSSCRSARTALVEQQRGERHSLVERHRGERIAERTACATGKDKARSGGAGLELDARRDLAEAKNVARRSKPERARSTTRERNQEDDDAVRSNLPAELVPVFDAVRKRIKPTGKKSRTEAFLDWAEENPEEILAVQQAKADRELRELMKQQRELGRTVRSAGRYKHSPEELEKLLEAVPF